MVPSKSGVGEEGASGTGAASAAHPAVASDRAIRAKTAVRIDVFIFGFLLVRL